jgi:hypothetical protein
MTSNLSNKNYTDNFVSLSDTTIEEIRFRYKVIDVPYLDPIKIRYNMFTDTYFQNNPGKKEIINNMLVFYLSHKNKAIYKKTDYLCNEKEKICICNTHAEDLRKIYDEQNYRPGDKYISWIRLKKDHFKQLNCF